MLKLYVPFVQLENYESKGGRKRKSEREKKKEKEGRNRKTEEIEEKNIEERLGREEK